MIPSLVDLCISHIDDVATKVDQDHPYRHSQKLPFIIQQILFKSKKNRAFCLRILAWLCSTSAANNGTDKVNRQLLCLNPKLPWLGYIIDLLQKEENEEFENELEFSRMFALTLLGFLTTGHRYADRAAEGVVKELPIILEHFMNDSQTFATFPVVINLLESIRSQRMVLENAVQNIPSNLVFYSFSFLYQLTMDIYNREEPQIMELFFLKVRSSFYAIKILTRCAADPILQEQTIELVLNRRFSVYGERRTFLPLTLFHTLMVMDYFNKPGMDKFVSSDGYVEAVFELADQLIEDKRIAAFLREHEPLFYYHQKGRGTIGVFGRVKNSIVAGIAAICYPLLCCFFSDFDD